MSTRDLPSDLGPALDPAVLARRASLPSKPEPIELRGAKVHLRPLVLERDLGALFAASSGRPVALGERTIAAYDADAAIWRYMSGGPFADEGALAAWLAPQIAAANGLCFVVIDAETDAPIGVANYIANYPEHLKIELGSIWYSPIAQGRGANAEATYLMLEHAFRLGYQRLEWKCDSRNERSRRAALRMGFVFEGIQQAQYIVKGRSRDTAWFRMLVAEWPEAAKRLRALF